MAFGRLITVISGPSGGTGTSISDCRISFDIEKSIGKTPNKSNVMIYNLSDTTMASMGKRMNKLIIKAGYKDENSLSTIFYGDINKSEISKEPPDTILKIEAMDGWKSLQQAIINKSYAAGTSISTVVNDIVSEMGFVIGGTKPNISGSYAPGYVASGKCGHVLSKVLNKVGYTWSIQNDQIYIFEEGGSAKTFELSLASDTGLLSISKLEHDAKLTKSAKSYYTIRTLLFPQIIPGAQVYIKSSLATGNMIVQNVTMSGDSYEGDFIVEAEVKAA